MADTKKVLRDHFDALRAEKTALEGQTAGLKSRREALCVEREATTLKIRALTSEINAIERPRIIDLSEEISAVAQALGGRKMSDGATSDTDAKG